jgi:ABC-2 type transport system permease protein
MLAKVWSMAAVVLLAATLSLVFVVQGLLDVPIEGSVPLFLAGAALHLFATTSLGIFMATVARNMPQFGMLLILTLIPLQMLSGGVTPRESMPVFVQYIMLASPTTLFISLSQAILFRGAGFDMVWTSFLSLLVIGAGLSSLSLSRFRKTISQMA